jgi:hypothetical protein
MVAVALCSAAYVFVAKIQFSYRLSEKPLEPNKWPRPFQALRKDDLIKEEQLRAYALSRFLNERAILSLAGSQVAVDKLISEFRLIPTNGQHQFARELQAEVRSDWKKPNFANCKWYTTPGFGTVHMEGQDLFLIATDPETGISIILYDWIF